MNTYEITFQRENGTTGSGRFTAATETQARRDFKEVYRHWNGTITNVELVAEGTPATKEQERKALIQIKKIVDSLGKNSYAIENGEVKKKYSGEEITEDEVSEWLNHELELIEVAMDKQGYLENCLDEIGGIPFSKENIKVGYIVRMQRFGVAEIVSTGSLNVVYKILNGGAAGGILKGAYAEITEIIKAEEKKHTNHTFKVGEQFKACVWDNGFHSVVYEIVKATDATIQLRPIGTNDKPITRKPVMSADGTSWRFSIDDSYGNTFYK